MDNMIAMGVQIILMHIQSINNKQRTDHTLPRSNNDGPVRIYSNNRAGAEMRDSSTNGDGWDTSDGNGSRSGIVRFGSIKKNKQIVATSINRQNNKQIINDNKLNMDENVRYPSHKQRSQEGGEKRMDGSDDANGDNRDSSKQFVRTNHIYNRSRHDNQKNVDGIRNGDKNSKTKHIVNSQGIKPEHTLLSRPRFQDNRKQREQHHNVQSNQNERNHSQNHQIQAHPPSQQQQQYQQQQQEVDQYYNNESHLSSYDQIGGEEIKLHPHYTKRNPPPIRNQDENFFVEIGDLQTLNNQRIYNYDQHLHPYHTKQLQSRYSLQRQNTKYGPGGIQTLQFNPEHEKIVITDSKESEPNQCIFPAVSAFCEDFEIPDTYPIPLPTHTPQELVDIAKLNFTKLGCPLDDQTVISVKKYKNCVHFSTGNQHNILWHYEDGKFYFGGWKFLVSGEGQKYGQGIQYLPNKYKFKGYFTERKRTGFGTLINFDGSAYVGQWENGMRHGEGKQLDPQGIVYVGEFKQGKKSGYGKLLNNGKLEFQGVFAKGLKNGYGKQYFQNGDTYDGNYSNHKFDGKGTYCWKSGAVYTGQFKHGKRNGYGVWRSNGKNRDVYQGYYTDDKKHGKGVYRWPNGAVYDGWFKEDLKHGQGTITYENGKTARLIWVKGVVEKKLDTARDQDIPIYQMKHALTQRKTKEDSHSNSKSNQKSNFLVKNKANSRSTQSLASARSNSTTSNSHNFPTGIVFHTQSMKKLGKPQQMKYLSQRQQNSRVTKRTPIDNDMSKFDSLPSKYWNKNYIINQQKIKQSMMSKKPSLPKDRPYTGIQASSNINMDI